MYKVLIVDDEPMILEGFRKIIHWDEHGLEIAGECSHAEEALRLLEHTHVHILITDIRMPGVSGLTLIRQAKEICPSIKCVILSGFDDFVYVKESLQLGIENYLLKPVAVEELSLTLQNAVDKIESDLFENMKEREGANMLRQMILYRWVTGAIQHRELAQRAQMLGMEVVSEEYAVALIHVLDDEERRKRHKIQERNLRAFAIENICNETLQSLNLGEAFCELSGDIVLLFSGKRGSLTGEVLDSTLHGCIRSINGYLRADVFAAIGQSVCAIQDVPASYSSARDLLAYSFFMAPNNVVRHEEIKRSTCYDAVELPSYEELRRLVEERDKAGLLACLERVFAGLATAEGMTPERIRNVTIRLLIHLANIVRELGNRQELFADNPTLFTDVFAPKRIDELQQWLARIVDQTLESLHFKEARMNPVIREAIGYIRDNYASNLSIKQLSERFYLNPAYLGQLFKNETGEMFSNYLNRIRVEEAKKLLLTTQHKINEISDKVGYVSPIYFSRTFKKLCGKTPQDFKAQGR